MQDLKQELIGQKEGLQYALDMIRVQERSLENMIRSIDNKLKEIK